ncbi:NACHT domain-containing protein [Streptomyces sp. NPDC056296]|uniref:NACHT domain-containing protein n=1 Tax=Streptomyces sp. NPDC056296 TaxID=3345775 RepID=UPI0035D58DE8
MAGGRPPKDGGPTRYPELEELASWFRQSMADAGYDSPNAVVRAEIAHKNVVYGIHGASRFLKLDVVRALAVGLGRNPAEVEPLWTRAKEAVDRAAAARLAAETPHLTAWSQLPLPELALRNLVEAQSRAVERLPYNKLGVEEPPLSAVYVRPRIRTSGRTGEGHARGGARPDGDGAQRMAAPGRGESAQVLDAALPVPDALARHDHLLITGEPGAGKSTLSSHVAWTLARIWLRQESSLDAPVTEPVIPLRVAARTLVDRSGSWSSVLCRAAGRSLGRSLVTDPEPNLFAGRVQGARWLVLVDGLDEIADHDARTGVIRTIAQHARAGSDYRFVVTSRPLPESELAPLRGPLIGAYRIEPFRLAELRDFAGKWFTTQYQDDKERARAATDRFLKEIQDGRLRELVRNPLLATIAAVNATVDRSRPLPTSRLSLYQRFCEHLLTRGVSTAAFRSELNRRFHDDPERRSFHLWLDDHKQEVLGALGRCRVEGERSLSEAALRWVQEHAAERRLSAGWQTDVHEFLRGSGLLVPAEDDYRFLHHSFAEFMAAQSYVLEIPPDFPDVERWIRRASAGDERTLVMFLFCMWSERADCTADRITEQLLRGTRGGHERVMLAGMLLAEGVPGGGNLTLILDRLEAVARNAAVDDCERALEVLGALGGRPSVLPRLKRLASSEILDPMLRLYAVEAFSRAGDEEVAEQLLGSVLGWIYGAFPRAAEVACSIGQGAREAVRRRAWAVAEGPRANPLLLARIAMALERLGLPQEVAKAARRVLADGKAEAAQIKEAAEAWIKALPAEAETVVRLTMDRPAADQQGRAAVAKVLEEAGEPEAAARVAGGVLGSGTPDSEALESAARTWIKVRGAAGVPAVMEAFENSSADLGHDLDTPSALLLSVAAFSEEAEIAAWAQEVLGEHRWGTYEGGSVVSAWLAVGGLAAAGEVMERTGRGHLLEGYARAEAAEAMLDAGARREAVELAECALRTPNLSKTRYKQSAGVLLKVEADRAAEKLEGIWREPVGIDMNSAWLHGVLVAFSEHEADAPLLDAVACRFARELLDLGAADSGDVLLALETITELEGRGTVPYVVETAKAKARFELNWPDLCHIAQGLAALGEQAAALELWRHAISLPFPPQHTDLLLLTAVQSAEVAKEAASWMRELIADPDTYPPRRLRLRQMLAWLAAADPACAEHTAEPVAPTHA